jgi:negative regulator of flagellin synthesis FlgM
MKIGTAAESLVQSTTNGVNGQTRPSGGASVGRTGSVKDTVAGGASTGLATGGSATVALSSQAASLLQGAGGASAEFDAGKVDRISQAITEGSFSVDAAVIADKLIANAKELLGRAVA